MGNQPSQPRHTGQYPPRFRNDPRYSGHKLLYGGVPDVSRQAWVRPCKNPKKKKPADRPNGNRDRLGYYEDEVPEPRRGSRPPRDIPQRRGNGMRPHCMPGQFEIPRGMRGQRDGAEEEIGPGSRLPSGVGERERSNRSHRSQNQEMGAPPRRPGQPTQRGFPVEDDREALLSNAAGMAGRTGTGAGQDGKGKSRRPYGMRR